MSDSKISACCGGRSSPATGEHDPKRLASSESVSAASSIYVVMSTSGHIESSSENFGSIICLELFEAIPKLKTLFVSKEGSRTRSTSRGLRIATKDGKFFMEGTQKEDVGGQGTEALANNKPTDTCHTQTSFFKFKVQVSGHAVSMDTTEDRPCCCQPRPRSHSGADAEERERGAACAADVISDLMHPALTSDGMPGIQKEAYMNVGYSQTPSSFRTTVGVCEVPRCQSSTCHRGDSKVSWDLPPDYTAQQRGKTPAGDSKGHSDPPCNQATCYPSDDEIACQTLTHGAIELGQITSPPLHHPRGIPGVCKQSPCSEGCQPYFPLQPPAQDSPDKLSNRYSGVEFSPETMRIAKRHDNADTQSVGVGATCSMLSNLIGAL